ncbi:MAG: ribonuclease III, partial [Parasporobacterium sp.]|nr:ribonuclease III [Parasporobacterium sp.]
MNRNIDEFQSIIGYTFKNRNLLIQALTHSSYVNENRSSGDIPADNERLEFFGDAIIEFHVSEFLYEKYRSIQEGDLTRLRASMVCEQSLACCSRRISLGEFLLMGRGEEASGGRERASIISDAFEAVTAAIYLDSGRDAAETFIKEHLLKTVILLKT